MATTAFRSDITSLAPLLWIVSLTCFLTPARSQRSWAGQVSPTDPFSHMADSADLLTYSVHDRHRRCKKKIRPQMS